MSIREEARQEAERRWPHTGDTTVDIRRSALRHTFVKGVKWASEQADREPSDADVRAALSEWYRGIFSGGWTEQDEARMRAALLAAQEVRRNG